MKELLARILAAAFVIGFIVVIGLALTWGALQVLQWWMER